MNTFWKFGMDEDVQIVTENYTVENNGDILALQEAMEELPEIFSLIHQHEMAAITKQHGVVQESMGIDTDNCDEIMENAVKNIFNKLKQFLLKLKAKIKAYFDTLVAFLNGLVKENAAFAEKYEAIAKEKGLMGVEVTYTGKAFNDANIDNKANADVFTKAADAIEKVIGCPLSADGVTAENIDEKMPKIADAKIRCKTAVQEAILGGSGTGTGKTETGVLVNEYFYGAGGSAKVARKLKVSDALEGLKAAEKNSKFIREAMKDSAKYFDEIIKGLKTLEKEAENKDEKDSAGSKIAGFAQKLVSIATDAKEVSLAFLRGWRGAFNERNSQYKKVVVSALMGVAKDAKLK